MAKKHTVSCVALSAAIALKLFAGTAHAATWPTGKPIIVTDLSNPTWQLHAARGVDIASVDGEIRSGLVGGF